jgi:hypothetical protein
VKISSTTAKQHRLLITGSRDWRDEQAVEAVLADARWAHGLDLLVIHGGAPGADSIVGKVCDKLGIDQVVFPANWKGRRTVTEEKVAYWAGPWRNQMMIDLGLPHEAAAFHPMISRSKGTRDMVERLRAAKIPYRIHAGRSRP